MNDLTLLKKFKKIDLEEADAILSKMMNHKWYITQEAVVFALFSTLIDSNQKQNLAAKIVSTDKPQSFRQGKPVFPDVTSTITLVDLVDPESYLLFHTLNIKTDWVFEPVEAGSTFQNLRLLRLL